VFGWSLDALNRLIKTMHVPPKHRIVMSRTRAGRFRGRCALVGDVHDADLDLQ